MRLQYATLRITACQRRPSGSHCCRVTDGRSWLTGEHGRQYKIERILQEKDVSRCCVYLTSSADQEFVVKDIADSGYQYYREMYQDLAGSRYIRLLHDAIPQQSRFVYRYYPEHLLGAVQKGLALPHTKRILRDVLRGIAELHAKNIVHTDIKPNNILLRRGEAISETEVKIMDLEDACYVPDGSSLVGLRVGNQMWRSPEGHARGPVNKPTEIFSFGVTCIYAVLNKILFAVDRDALDPELEPVAIILERQIFYFADPEDVHALIEHLGDSPWCEILRVICDGFNDENPTTPFALMKDYDPIFKDFIAALTNLDPAKRVTAEEALAHEWLDDVKD